MMEVQWQSQEDGRERASVSTGLDLYEQLGTQDRPSFDSASLVT